MGTKLKSNDLPDRNQSMRSTSEHRRKESTGKEAKKDGKNTGAVNKFLANFKKYRQKTGAFKDERMARCRWDEKARRQGKTSHLIANSRKMKPFDSKVLKSFLNNFFSNIIAEYTQS